MQGRSLDDVCIRRVLLASRVGSLGAAVTLIAIASLFAFMAPQACWSPLQEIVPRERVGSAGGFVHLLANLAGILSPSVTGWLVQYGGGYSSAFVLAGASALAGAVILTFAVRARAVSQMRGLPDEVLRSIGNAGVS